MTHELVPAETRNQAIFWNLLLEARDDALQEPVADIVSEGVIDGLEMIEVDE